MLLLVLWRRGGWAWDDAERDPAAVRAALWVVLVGYVFVWFAAGLLIGTLQPSLAGRAALVAGLNLVLGAVAWRVACRPSSDASASAAATDSPSGLWVGPLCGIGAIGFAGWAGALLVWVYELVGVEVPGQRVAETVAAAEGLDAALSVVAAVLLAPIAEELLFRGVLLSRLRLALRTHAALVVQAVIFGWWHFAGDVTLWPLAIPLAFVGWWCGVARVRGGGLVAAILAHAVFNVAGVLQLRAAAG